MECSPKPRVIPILPDSRFYPDQYARVIREREWASLAQITASLQWYTTVMRAP